MQIVGWMILLLLIVARPAVAAFEGYIEMKMTMKEGAGTMKGQISSVGARTEVEARVAQMGDLPVTMTMLAGGDASYVASETKRSSSRQSRRRTTGENARLIPRTPAAATIHHAPPRRPWSGGDNPAIPTATP